MCATSPTANKLKFSFRRSSEQVCNQYTCQESKGLEFRKPPKSRENACTFHKPVTGSNQHNAHAHTRIWEPQAVGMVEGVVFHMPSNVPQASAGLITNLTLTRTQRSLNAKRNATALGSRKLLDQSQNRETRTCARPARCYWGCNVFGMPNTTRAATTIRLYVCFVATRTRARPKSSSMSMLPHTQH